jgi:hypothetical protein
MSRLAILFSAFSLAVLPPETETPQENAPFFQTVEISDAEIQKRCALETLYSIYDKDPERKIDIKIIDDDDGTHTATLKWNAHLVDYTVSVNYAEKILVSAENNIEPQNTTIHLSAGDGETATITGDGKFTTTIVDKNTSALIFNNLSKAQMQAVAFQQNCLLTGLQNRQPLPEMPKFKPGIIV